MSAAEMREAAAKLAARWRADMVERHGEEAGLFADRIEAAIRATPLPAEEGMVEEGASPENTWSGIRAGLTYEQNALLRAYGASTYEERERALDQIARDIAERVAKLEARAAIRAINGGKP